MNGPQRTACLANSCINNHYKSINNTQAVGSSMVTSMAMLHVRQAEPRPIDRQCAAARFLPLSRSRSQHPVMSEAADDP